MEVLLSCLKRIHILKKANRTLLSSSMSEKKKDLKKIYSCRVCNSDEVESFVLKHFTFKTKNLDWKSFFCFNCGAVSEFNLKNKRIDYEGGSYRANETLLSFSSENDKILPPVNSWSTITFARWKNIYKVLNINKEVWCKDAM